VINSRQRMRTNQTFRLAFLLPCSMKLAKEMFAIDWFLRWQNPKYAKVECGHIRWFLMGILAPILTWSGAMRHELTFLSWKKKIPVPVGIFNDSAREGTTKCLTQYGICI
jgi:hypothetical protein